MKTFVPFACLLACAASIALPPFDVNAFLGLSAEEASALDPSYSVLDPKARDLSSLNENLDWDGIQQALAEHEALLKKQQDLLDLNVELDWDAFQAAIEKLVQESKEERTNFALDLEAYQKMLEELNKEKREAYP